MWLLAADEPTWRTAHPISLRAGFAGVFSDFCRGFKRRPRDGCSAETPIITRC